jgi:hypothetical protein
MRALFVALLCTAASGAAQDHGAARRPELRAALGVAALPTPAGSALAGYGGLVERSADGVLDAPEARALLLERGELRVAIVALDLLLIRPELRAELLASAAARGLDGLVLAATHTHSGPGGYVPGWLAGRVTGARYDPEAARRLAGAAAAALADAAAQLRTARAGAARVQLGLAENRRRPSGSRETALELLRIDLEGADPIALVVYGAHATVLSPRNRSFSADYPGALRRWLDARGFDSLFLQGPLGDQQPDSKLAPEEAEPPEVEARQLEAVGAAIGAAALPALSELSTHADAPLGFAELELEAPDLRPRRGCALWWLAPISRPALRRIASPRVRFQALRIGAARLLFVPAEPSAEVGAALRKAGSSDAVGVVALANDWIGYAVTRGEYERGGYEACMSFAGADGASWLVDGASRTLALLESAP